MQSRSIALLLGTLLVAAIVFAALPSPARQPAGAMGDNSITSPDSASDVGYYTSLALDAAGYPVVGYHTDPGADLKVLHCNDPDCSGGDESITTPDTSGEVGDYSSLALDPSGYPVVAYYDHTDHDLKLLHCNDANCTGGDESITSPDTGSDVGRHASLALDESGHPVVSYYDLSNGDLKVLRCNDQNCSGDDESITSPDTDGVVGVNTSLALDTNGNPVVGYQDGSNADLKVLHCNDPNCEGGDESVTSPDTDDAVGWSISLALDSDGYPVLSYYDNANMLSGNLKVLHCNDPDCAGIESITSVGPGGSLGSATSLALDSSDNPVVAYRAGTSAGLNVLHCNDPYCAGSGDTIVSPDTDGSAGTHASLVLDGAGNPVVSYHDDDNGGLKLLHCNDHVCSGVKGPPTPGLTSTATRTPAPTLLPTEIPPVTATPSRTGDVDCNATVNSVDAALILQLAADLIETLPCTGNADANEDGITDPIDAALILQLSAGLIPSLPA